MSSISGRIRPSNSELLALEWRKFCGKRLFHANTFQFYQIFVELASNQDIRTISVEFHFGPDRTIPFGVTCPWWMNILLKLMSPHLRFKYWSHLRYLQVTWIVTWTGIKSRTCLTSGRIGNFTSELLALVWRNFCGKWYTLANASVVIWSSLNLQGIGACIKSQTNSILDQIGLCILEFYFGVTCPWMTNNFPTNF